MVARAAEEADEKGLGSKFLRRRAESPGREEHLGELSGSSRVGGGEQRRKDVSSLVTNEVQSQVKCCRLTLLIGREINPTIMKRLLAGFESGGYFATIFTSIR